MYLLWLFYTTSFTLFLREEMNRSTMGFSIVTQIVQATICVAGYVAALAHTPNNVPAYIIGVASCEGGLLTAQSSSSWDQ